MEKNTKISILKKIAIILLAIVICYFIIPTPVNAVSWLAEAGGALIDWILQLFIFLGDCVLDLLQNNFISTQDVIIQAEASSQANFSAIDVIEILIGVLVIAIGVCIAIASFGTLSWASLAAIAGSIKVIGGVVLATAGGAALFVHGTSELVDGLQGKFDLPMIRYTPYEIFSGQIPVFDVNFIEPLESVYEVNEIKVNKEWEDSLWWENLNTWELFISGGYVENEEFKELCEYLDDKDGWTKKWSDTGNTGDKSNTMGTSVQLYTAMVLENKEVIFSWNWVYTGAGARYRKEPEDKFFGDDSFVEYGWYDGKIYKLVGCDIAWSNSDDYWTIYEYDVYEIFSDSEGEEILHKTKEYKSTSSILQSSISTWYRVLRTVALVGLLSVVVYIGIRILFTSIAEDKAKYKKMIIDWIVAICILFILHYLMAFILTVSSSLTEIFVAKGEENILVALPTKTTVDGERLPLSESNESEFKDRPVWSTSFVGYVRLLAGSYEAGEKNAGLMHIAYAIIYIVLVIYTLMFTFMYLKRAIYMAFLTMIAPLIALTYPLDKIKDGKAQAFALWIREYIFNCLMQPIHLIIYTMVISTVMEYVKDHPIYALVALGFLIPAEQFVRKMFGFEKAGTVSELGKLAGGAAVMSGINKLSNLNKRRPKDEEENNNSKVRTKEQGGYGLDVPNSSNSAQSQSRRQSSSGTTRGRNASQSGGQQNTTRTTTVNTTTPTEIHSQTTDTTTTQNTGRNGNSGQSTQNVINENNNQNITGGNPANTSNQNGSNKNKIGFGGRLVAGMNSVGTHYKNRAIKSKPLRTIGKWTGKLIGGAAIGTIGLAAGIASGDASKALSYTAAGAGVGGALGGTLSENVMDEAKTIRTNFSKGYQGGAEYTNKRLDDKFFASSEYQKIINDHSLYPELLGNPIEQQSRVAKIQEEIKQYRKSGITDTKKMVKAMKMKLSPKQGVYAIQLAERIGKSGWNKEETRLRYYNDYFGILGDEEEAKKIWEAIPKLLF